MRDTTRLVQRYQPRQRTVHWLGVISFMSLLITGLFLLVPSLSGLAAGGRSRLVHRIAAVAFFVMPILYLVLMPKAAIELVKESFTYHRRDLAWFKRMPAYMLGSTKGLPPTGKLNPGQRLHHAASFLAFQTIAYSGFVLWFFKDSLGPTGLSAALIIHDLSMLLLVVLMLGHVYFTFLYGALPAMTTGYVSEDYARLEHGEWFDEITAARAAEEVDSAL